MEEVVEDLVELLSRLFLLACTPVPFSTRGPLPLLFALGEAAAAVAPAAAEEEEEEEAEGLASDGMGLGLAMALLMLIALAVVTMALRPTLRWRLDAHDALL